MQIYVPNYYQHSWFNDCGQTRYNLTTQFDLNCHHRRFRFFGLLRRLCAYDDEETKFVLI